MVEAAKNQVVQSNAQVVQDKYLNDIGFRALIQKSNAFQHLKEELKSAVKISMTGITNLIVNHEDSVLVDDFLKECFKMEELYNNTIDIDAVELQAGSPGKGYSTKYIDELIYGTFETKNDPDSGMPVVETDPLTGKRKRRPDGFVTRREVIKGEFKDKTLIIKNIDYSLDFCKDTPGVVDPRSSWVFDNFRKTNVKRGCRLLIVTNKKIVLPFSTRTIELSPVSELEANHVIDSFIRLYKRYSYEIDFTKSQMEQMIRKISGLTYTLAADSIGYSFSVSESPKGSKKINSSLVLKHLREKINKGFMENGHGLSHLVSRPWEDYICPESSNFTYDVKKIMRDFSEIERLKLTEEENIKKGIDESETVKTIEAIQHRIPHRIVLYGKGGVGKCLGRGTPVIMFDGTLKNVEDIKVNELLMGPDSKPRKVMSTTYGVGSLYRVDQKNGDSYVCNDAHILSLQNAQKSSDSKPIFISAEDFYKKDKNYKKYNNGWKTGVEFLDKWVPIDPYWFGLWLGDGTSLKPAITVADKDIEIGKWLEGWANINNLFIRKESKKEPCKAKAWNFSPRKGSGYCHNDVKIALQTLGVLGNKHIPHIYLTNSTEMRLHLLAGLLDSDGDMTKTGSLQFTNVNKRLAIEVLHLVRSLGFKGFWSEGIKGIKDIDYKVMAYTVTIGGNLSRIPTKLFRKKGHDNPQKKTLKCGISISPIGEGEYFGFTLNGDHQFLLGDFTVTHNSAFPVHLAGLLEFDIWDFNINATHSKWIGEGSKQMREDLKKISAASHVIIRIDEYDRAIGSAGESGQGMHEAHKQVESEFMNWLQNADENNLFIKNNIILVLTTNHKDNITGPLLRSGRSDLVIDIDNFDSKSMKEAFTTCSRRMKNKGMKILGFDSQEDLQKAINALDVEQLSEIATLKGFTVRDIETFISEMAAHAYFYKITGGKDGFAWTTENFVEILNNSEGSIKDDTTGELVLGDRFVFQQREKAKITDSKKEAKTIANPSKFEGFEEK